MSPAKKSIFANERRERKEVISKETTKNRKKDKSLSVDPLSQNWAGAVNLSRVVDSEESHLLTFVEKKNRAVIWRHRLGTIEDY